jgi:acyl-CoA synthetase (AMP-forming)/AMP-acid ligase II
MPALRYDASTVVWEDGVVHHRLEDFPELVEESRGEYSVRAYEDRPESIDEMFREAVEHAPDREAFVFPEMGVRFTYRELESRVASIAGGLHDAGVEPGDRVMVHLSNRREFVETFFACARLNAVSVPTNTRLTAGERPSFYCRVKRLPRIIPAPTNDVSVTISSEIPRPFLWV